MRPLPPSVRDAIEAVRSGRSKTLTLTDVQTIPEGIRDLPNLEELWLGPLVRSLPDYLPQLKNLRVLDVSDARLDHIPNWPGLVMDWRQWQIYRKSISPENVVGIQARDQTPSITELRLFPHLRRLSLISPHARDLVNSVHALEQLEHLYVWNIPLSTFPSSVRGLANLRILTIGYGGLREIPSWVEELSELRAVSFVGNDLLRFPDALFAIAGLKIIDVRKRAGQIREIPPTILRATSLTELAVDGHPIQTPPMEIVNAGVDAIKTYWRQRHEQGSDYLCEAKLIIIGEAGAGKTSLGRKIINPAYELRPDEPSTEGIEIGRWLFPATLQPQGKTVHRDIRVNIWDFGGQEIYHATHQFFLTRRSVYVLVADDRKEDTDFEYWLNIVDLLSDGSPVIIVANEKQDRSRHLDFSGLRARFGNIRDIRVTNLATNRGLEGVLGAIRRELQSLTHIGAELPKNWRRVREALEAEARDHISLDEYLYTCDRYGVSRLEDKLQLSGYLHDIGVCLHFQDDALLRNLVILKPRWGTDAVYRVLDDGNVRGNRGHFTPTDLDRIWSGPVYSAMRHELIQLMMRFQLCYALPDGDAYIAPQLLSAAQPLYQWDHRANLVLRYEYDVMPKGILTRCIVRMHRLIIDQALVWKTGVVVEREGTRAEVTEDYGRRKITVRLAGSDTRSLLAIVDHELDQVHHAFARLKYEKLVPCDCPVCHRATEPYAFPLSKLREFALRGRPIQCHVSGELVNPRTLLADILPAALRDESTGVQTHLAGTTDRKEVYFSYKWAEQSSRVVDTLQAALAARHIECLRDVDQIHYRDSIRGFMRRVGTAKAVVVVISDAYLKSINCMYELAEIAAAGELRKRVFPIILDDAKIYRASGLLDYIEYWENEHKVLEKRLRRVKGSHVTSIREELEILERIRSLLDDIVATLRDMNAFTFEEHEGAQFDVLVQGIESRFGE